MSSPQRPKSTPVSPASPSGGSRTFLKDSSSVCFPKAPRVGSFSRWSTGMEKTMAPRWRSGMDSMHMGNPGPGAYNPTAWNLPSAAQYSLSPRRNLVDARSGAPGPAAYNPINPSHKPRGIALGQKLSFGSAYTAGGGANPGPAAYNVDTMTAITSPSAVRGGKPKSPAYSFGAKIERGGPYAANGRSTTPGPGAYDIPEARTQVAFSMTHRSINKVDSLSPGPGAYNLPYGTTRRGRYTNSSHSIHSKLRGPGRGYNVPGPGQYEAPQQFHSVPLPGSPFH